MGQGIRVQQRERTRRALVRAGREMFASPGYSAIGLSQLVAAAGVSKGALYHQFDSKAELFRAVLEQVQQEVAEQVAGAAATERDPWQQLLAGCREFLTASTDPDRQRIMLIDGPAVLGWAQWRAMDEAASASRLGETLTALVKQGVIRPQPVLPLVHLLSGAMYEAALWLATTTDPQDLADTWDALSRLLESLLAKDGEPAGSGHPVGGVADPVGFTKGGGDEDGLFERGQAGRGSLQAHADAEVVFGRVDRLAEQ